MLGHWSSITDSRIIISDISDHLPILTCFDLEIRNCKNSSIDDTLLINEEGRTNFGIYIFV